MMKKNILLIKDYLDKLYPDPICELNYTKDYELLIAVMLSAQSTDKKVNLVTKELFSEYDTLEKLSKANLDRLKEIIRPIGTYNKKALNILDISKKLITKYNKIVPKTHEDLESMKGIGRKSASVVLLELYNIPQFPVDTHIIRVSNRLNLVNSKDPVEIEKKLKEYFKKDEWIKRHKQLVLFGRYHCKALKPNCSNCFIKNICSCQLKDMLK